MQWLAIFQKEMLESWRNRKWIWVPLALTLVAVMDPLSYYYLPEIIELVGGVPEDTIIEIPTLKGPEVIMMSLNQLSTFGVMVIAFASMGTIAGEQKDGQSEMILVKPVRHFNYITAKWVAYLVLTWSGLSLSLFLSGYYINLLFDGMALVQLLQITCFYGLWLTFVLTLSFLFNTLFKRPGIVAGCTITTLVVLSGLNMAIGHRFIWFPNQLSAHIQELVLTETIPSDLLATAGIMIALIILLITASVYIFKRKEIV